MDKVKSAVETGRDEIKAGLESLLPWESGNAVAETAGADTAKYAGVVEASMGAAGTAGVSSRRPSTTAPPRRPPPSPEPMWRFLLKFVYDKNPLYLLSAMLLLYAQSALFASDPLMPRTEIPALIIVLYALLMSGTALLIARRWRVWDDAASIALILQALFLVISATMDGMLLETPWLGRLALGGGGLLSVGMAAGLVFGLRLRAPRSILAVYAAIMALFFLAPAYIASRVAAESPVEEVRLLIMAFPAAAAGLFLLLFPWAAHQRRWRLADNGTPWHWPGFPWGAFAVLAGGVVFRTYLLAISFVGGSGAGPYSSLESGFMPFMVVPFLFALAILALEAAATAGNHALAKTLMAVPVALSLLSLLSPSNPAARGFVNTLPYWYSPFFAAAVLAALFYVWAWFRRVEKAESLLHLTLAALCLPFLSNGRVGSLGMLDYLPPMAILAILLALALVSRSAIRYLLAAWLCQLFAMIILGRGVGGLVDNPHFWAAAGGLALLTPFVVSALCEGSFAADLRLFCAVGIPLYSIYTGYLTNTQGWLPTWWIYPSVGLVVLALGSWLVDKRYRYSLAVVAAAASCWLAGKQARLAARFWVKGMGWAIAAMAVFGFAFAISAAKGKRQLAAKPGGEANKPDEVEN